MTEKEHQAIKRKADRSKRTLSCYMINAALDKNIVVIENLTGFVHQLNKIGGNLNQLTMLYHQGKISNPNIDEVKETIKNIYSLLLQMSDPNKK
jgi:hypothetical protein